MKKETHNAGQKPGFLKGLARDLLHKVNCMLGGAFTDKLYPQKEEAEK